MGRDNCGCAVDHRMCITGILPRTVIQLKIQCCGIQHQAPAISAFLETVSQRIPLIFVDPVGIALIHHAVFVYICQHQLFLCQQMRIYIQIPCHHSGVMPGNHVIHVHISQTVDLFCRTRRQCRKCSQRHDPCCHDGNDLSFLHKNHHPF